MCPIVSVHLPLVLSQDLAGQVLRQTQANLKPLDAAADVCMYENVGKLAQSARNYM